MGCGGERHICSSKFSSKFVHLVMQAGIFIWLQSDLFFCKLCYLDYDNSWFFFLQWRRGGYRSACAADRNIFNEQTLQFKRVIQTPFLFFFKFENLGEKPGLIHKLNKSFFHQLVMFKSFLHHAFLKTLKFL